MSDTKPFAVFHSNSLWFDREDNGCALISQLDEGESSDGLFVRVQSWDPTKKHELALKLRGKRVRVEVYFEDE